MSSLPGYHLEDLIEWNYNLVVEDDRDDVNISLMIAEKLGNIPARPRISPEMFKELVKRFDPWREYVEHKLEDFDEDEQSWRQQSQYVCESVPEEVWDWANKFLERNRVI